MDAGGRSPAVVKVLGERDVSRAAQDGRVSIRYGGEPMDLRMAVLPTTHGEQVVLRILARHAGMIGLGELGMSAGAEEMFLRAIRQPYGAVITCGPTGSGKTTTLYAALDPLNDAGRVLMTIEDPVEYQIPGVNQIEVHRRAGLTFARGYVRSCAATRTFSSSVRSATRRRRGSRSRRH